MAVQITTIFAVINSILIGIMVFLMVFGFYTALMAYLRIRKNISTDQSRIENGEVVLLKDSVLEKILYYANKDYRSNPNLDDPLSMHSQLAISKWIFMVSQMLIMITLFALMLYIFFVIFSNSPDGNNADTIKDSLIRLGVPILFAAAISAVMVIYVKAIYHKMQTEVLMKDINKLYSDINAANGLKNVISANMSSITADAGFYTALQTKTISQMKTEIMNGNPSPTVLQKRIVTLSLYDYFNTELPNFSQSPIRHMFDASKQNFDTYNPADYVRMDCSRIIENYAYKYDLRFNASLSEENKTTILNESSKSIAAINESIAKLRIDIQPVVIYMENFFRTSYIYMFFMTAIVVIAVLRYYNLYETIVGLFKALWEKIKGWFGRKDTGGVAGAPAAPGAPVGGVVNPVGAPVRAAVGGV